MDDSRKIRVLLVDDEKDFVDILAKRLEVRDFNVTCVYNGDEAVTGIQSGEYDVVLLDLLMPGKSGLDILKEMKVVDPLIHIIMLTGHARVDTAIQGMELGAYDYLIKPVETEELVEKIRLAHSHKTAEAEKIQHKKTLETGSRSGWGTKIFSPLSRFFRKDQQDDAEPGSSSRSREKPDPSDP